MAADPRITFCGKAIEDMDRAQLIDCIKQLNWLVADMGKHIPQAVGASAPNVCEERAR
jgi:hypothetical protein